MEENKLKVGDILIDEIGCEWELLSPVDTEKDYFRVNIPTAVVTMDGQWVRKSSLKKIENGRE